MGRKQTDIVRKYYTLNLETKEQTCIIRNCGAKISNNNATNMRRHLKNKHKDKYTEYQLLILNDSSKNKNVEKEIIKTKYNRHELKQACVGMVADGATFKLFNSRNFRQIIGPIASALEMTINAESVKQDIALTSLNIKTAIKNDLKNKLFSLKIDEATRLNRSILGINVQYIQHNAIIIKTIAMVELTQRHTSDYIKQIILNTLASYELKVEQIYTITCDNGRNMIKASRLINNQIDCFPELDTEVAYDGQTIIENLNEAVETIVKQYKNKSDLLANTIKCAAHTVQLAVNDFLKDQSNVVEKIAKLRNLSIYLRTPTHRNILNQNNLRQPLLNNITRWNSTYNMIERLLDFKDYCRTYEHIYKDLLLEDDIWGFAVEYIEVFQPIKTITLQLQNTQLCLGQFFKCWLELKITLERIINPMAVILLNKIKERENSLLENNIVSAAMFLDPRFHCTMPQQNRQNSIEHLKKLYEHHLYLQDIQQDSLVSNLSTTSSSGSSASSSSTVLDIHDLMNAYIAEHNQTETFNSINNNHSDKHIAFTEISNYSPQPLDVNTNVLDYWSVKKEEFPYISVLAKIVHAVPATQCSVERCFSSLKLLLSDQRNKLSADMINDILIVKCNSNFQYEDNY